MSPGSPARRTGLFEVVKAMCVWKLAFFETTICPPADGNAAYAALIWAPTSPPAKFWAYWILGCATWMPGCWAAAAGNQAEKLTSSTFAIALIRSYVAAGSFAFDLILREFVVFASRFSHRTTRRQSKGFYGGYYRDAVSAIPAAQSTCQRRLTYHPALR